MAKKRQKKITRKKVTARKSRVKKSSAKKTSSRKRAAKLRRLSSKWRLLRAGLSLVLIVLVLTVVYAVYLDYRIKGTFAGQPWQKPARVYARPVELYAGKALSADNLEAHLQQLGYAHVSKPEIGGQYVRINQRIRLISRAMRTGDHDFDSVAADLIFSKDAITRLHDGRNRPLPIVQLDPLLIGSIIPQSGEDRMVIGASEVPGILIDALIAVEDRKFYQHHGVDPKGILRAAFANVRAGQVEQGGSTITQQLIKSHFLSNQRSWRRKFKEALMAIGLDARMHKDDIMLAYINEIYLGQDGRRAIHGFDLASRFYFARPLAELELHQTATLVGIVRGPSFYNPRRHPERAMQRRNQVLEVMVQQHIVSAEAAADARQRPLGLVTQKIRNNGNYPAFLSVVRAQLLRDYKKEDLTSVGLSVHTTLDVLLQNKVEILIRQAVASVEASARLDAGVLQSAAVIITPDTGELAAVVGGRNPGFDGFNRAVDMRRPVGSLLKPFVYLAALESGRYDLNTRISNAPLALELDNGDSWEPGNYSGEYGGDLPLYRAFADSINVPAVRVGMDIGVNAVIDILRRLGFERNLDAFPSLLLGAVEMSPVEVAGLYAGIAGQGFVSSSRAVRSVSNDAGTALSAYPLEVSQRVDARAVYQTIANLKLVVSHGTGRGLGRYLPAPLIVAGKTGTTNDYRDSWFAGFSGDVVAVVWLGADDNQPTGLTGSRGALPVWAQIMAASGQRSVEVQAPESLLEISVEYDSGESARHCDHSVLIPLRPGNLPADAVRCPPSY